MIEVNKTKLCRLIPAAGLALCLSLFGVVSSASSQEELTPTEPRVRREDLHYETQIEGASAVAWSPDGTVLAVGDDTGIRLFTDQLEFVQLLPQPTQLMEAVAWSPDGEMIAAVGADDVWRKSVVHIWQVDSGIELGAFEPHEQLVPTLVWSPDSTRIASGSWDRTLKIWDPLTGTIFQSIQINSHGVAVEIMSVSWSSQRNRLPRLHWELVSTFGTRRQVAWF
jgi:WD40 repeat protein